MNISKIKSKKEKKFRYVISMGGATVTQGCVSEHALSKNLWYV